MILGLFTDLLAAGGVQRASRQTAAGLANFAAAHNLPYRFLSLNDSRGPHTLQSGGCEFSIVGYGRNKNDFALAALRAAGAKPRLIVAMHPHLAPIVSAMKFRWRKSRSMIFTHGIEVWRPLAWPRGGALRRADVVVAPSEDTARRLVSTQDVSPERILRLPWGLDPDFERRLLQPAPVRPAAFPEGAPIVLTVGRWDPAERYKGADTLISAMPAVLHDFPSAVLVLVGDGGDRPRLEQLAQAQNVADHTRFLFGLTPDELFACYAHCDLFALPSSGEGFGLVFLEAMANGKPAIGGAHGGILDVVVDGVTGVLAPHGDVTRLAAAIKWFLSDPARASEMGARGRERVQALYTSEQFQARLREACERVLDPQLGASGQK